MTAKLNNITVEIIEQLASGLWVVIILETGQQIEVDQSELTEIEY
jgi:hypothetical protein